MKSRGAVRVVEGYKAVVFPSKAELDAFVEAEGCKRSTRKKKTVVSNIADLKVDVAPGTSVWVQCDACLKWRRVPPDQNSSELPEVWTCKDWNISCEVPEVVSKEVDLTPVEDAEPFEPIELPSTESWPGYLMHLCAAIGNAVLMIIFSMWI